MAFTLGRAAGTGLLAGGGGARYPLAGSRGFVGVTFLLSFSFVPESSLFLFLGGGFGFSYVFEELSSSSFSSFKNGFVLTGSEFVSLGESLTLSGLSGPNICKRDKETQQKYTSRFRFLNNHKSLTEGLKAKPLYSVTVGLL